MYWGRLHPRVTIISTPNVNIDLPACMGDPARQIEIEEVNENFENISFATVPQLIGYRLTFILSFGALAAEDMDKVFDVLNHQGDFKLQPWLDKNKFYDVVRLNSEIDMQYHQDSAILRFKTRDVLPELYMPGDELLPRINRTGGII